MPADPQHFASIPTQDGHIYLQWDRGGLIIRQFIGTRLTSQPRIPPELITTFINAVLDIKRSATGG